MPRAGHFPTAWLPITKRLVKRDAEEERKEKSKRKKAEEDSDGELIGAEEGGDVQQDKWPENGRMTSGNARDDGGERTPRGHTMTTTGGGRGGWAKGLPGKDTRSKAEQSSPPLGKV